MSKASRERERERDARDAARTPLPGRNTVVPTGHERYMMKKVGESAGVGIINLRRKYMGEETGGIKSAMELAAERANQMPEPTEEEVALAKERLQKLLHKGAVPPKEVVLPEFGCHNCDHINEIENPMNAKERIGYCKEGAPELIVVPVQIGKAVGQQVQGQWPLMKFEDTCGSWVPKGYVAFKRKQMMERMGPEAPYLNPGVRVKCAMLRPLDYMKDGDGYHSDVTPPTPCAGENCTELGS